MEQTTLKVAFTGGATGGHIYPNLAVAAALHKRTNVELSYFGHPEKLEYQLLTNEEVKDDRAVPYQEYLNFVSIRGKALPRGKDLLKFIPWLFSLLREVNIAKKELKTLGIQVVFGTGGYIAVPVFMAAQQLGIPYIIHNLDAHLGLANRMFLRKAKFITLAFPIKDLLGGDIARLIGNPISAKFFAAKKTKNKDLNILVTGGSQGADSINNTIAEMLSELKKHSGPKKINIKHVTGKANYEKYISAVPEYHGDFLDYEVIAYTHQMPELCHWADLAICRSGAMTIAEMAAARVVPVFIPLPWAANDHQTLNAKYLVDAGAAYSLRQDDPKLAQKLMQIIKDGINEPSKLSAMQEKLKPFANESAAEELVELIVSAV